MVIVITFTYFIGIAIAIFSEQIDLTIALQRRLIIIVSIFFLSIAIILISSFLKHLKDIPNDIARLRNQ